MSKEMYIIMPECLNHFTSKAEYDAFMESSTEEDFDKTCNVCPNMSYDYNQGIITCKKFSSDTH